MTRLNTFMLMAAIALGGTAAAGPEAMQNLQKPQAGVPVDFSFGGENGCEFMLNGKAFQIRSGEIHPQRVPRQYWQHRIRAAKAMGLNTIAFYVFWNQLEQKDGSWDFSGMNDIAAFIDLCQQEGMWVLFRPGPFVCGEWDMGGLPAYLLKDGPAELRNTRNPQFMAAQTRYLDKMAEIAIPRLAKNGGPILMIQLENEYGSYRSPHDEIAYIEWLRDYWKGKGAERFYLSEGSSPMHLRFVVPEVAVGLDPADRESDTRHARKVVKNAPVFSSETYPGWLRHWGEGNWLPSRKTLNSVRWYMQSGFSFNLFVLHGGTSFGLTAGSNADNNTGANFMPDLTSYDYGSPIGEHGNLTREYFEYRDIIRKALPAEANVPEPPATPETMTVPAFTPELVCPFFQLRKTDAGQSEQPRTLESVGQNQGIAVYTATVPAGEAARLHLTVRDYAQVYLGADHVGDIDRRTNPTGIDLPARKSPQALTVVLDTFGHVNFSNFIEKDDKGIIGPVKLGDTELKGWEMKLLPLDAGEPQPGMPNRMWTPNLKGGLFRAEIELDKVADTFLNMEKWPKGYVWVNGHLLGRYWNIGPQFRLYCPAEFLNKGKNTITILDTMTSAPAPIRGELERNMEVNKVTESLNNQW